MQQNHLAMQSEISFDQEVFEVSLQVRFVHHYPLWRKLILTKSGNGLNVVKIMPETAIKFGSYEAAKRALANFEGHGDPKQLSSWSKFASGGLAGMIAQYG